MPRSERRVERVRQVLRRRQPDLTVILENIHDPHNVSAALRSCDTVGVMSVCLLYNQEKFPRIGKKSASSANKWIERRKFTTVDDCYSTLRSEGFAVYATHLSSSAVSLYDVDMTKRVALVFGNEHRGVSEEAASKADKNFVIPMVGMVQSLNISVACAVSLYEAMRQRSVAGAYDAPKLPPVEIERLFSKWIEL